MKELLLVCIGSFFGGGMRYLVGQLHVRLTGPEALAYGLFPWGTFAVNIIGCLLIGLFTGIAASGHLPAQWKLVLVTGFCGGFTTFSTFMNEGAGLMKEENYLYMMLYLFGSLTLGLVAVLAGHYLAKIIA